MDKDRRINADLDRIVTRAEADAQRQGSTRMAPGIWLDADGDVHFSVPELLALVDLEDTPANRESVTRVIMRSIREEAPGVPIIRQDPES